MDARLTFFLSLRGEEQLFRIKFQILPGMTLSRRHNLTDNNALAMVHPVFHRCLAFKRDELS